MPSFPIGMANSQRLAPAKIGAVIAVQLSLFRRIGPWGTPVSTRQRIQDFDDEADPLLCVKICPAGARSQARTHLRDTDATAGEVFDDRFDLANIEADVMQTFAVLTQEVSPNAFTADRLDDFQLNRPQIGEGHTGREIGRSAVIDLLKIIASGGWPIYNVKWANAKQLRQSLYASLQVTDNYTDLNQVVEELPGQRRIVGHMVLSAKCRVMVNG